MSMGLNLGECRPVPKMGLLSGWVWVGPNHTSYLYFSSIRLPVDNCGTVVGENPDCLLLSGTLVGENPDHV